LWSSVCAWPMTRITSSNLPSGRRNASAGMRLQKTDCLAAILATRLTNSRARRVRLVRDARCLEELGHGRDLGADGRAAGADLRGGASATRLSIEQTGHKRVRGPADATHWDDAEIDDAELWRGEGGVVGRHRGGCLWWLQLVLAVRSFFGSGISRQIGNDADILLVCSLGDGKSGFRTFLATASPFWSPRSGRHCLAATLHDAMMMAVMSYAHPPRAPSIRLSSSGGGSAHHTHGGCADRVTVLRVPAGTKATYPIYETRSLSFLIHPHTIPTRWVGNLIHDMARSSLACALHPPANPGHWSLIHRPREHKIQYMTTTTTTTTSSARALLLPLVPRSKQTRLPGITFPQSL
jgi:hypothetical protein